VVGLQDLIELGSSRERDEGLARSIVQHGDRLRGESHMDVTEELAHLLGTVAPRKAAQPRNVWLLHARFQHGACHRRDQIARRQLRRLVSDREHLTTRRSRPAPIALHIRSSITIGTLWCRLLLELLLFAWFGRHRFARW